MPRNKASAVAFHIGEIFLLGSQPNSLIGQDLQVTKTYSNPQIKQIGGDFFVASKQGMLGAKFLYRASVKVSRFLSILPRTPNLNVC